MIKKLTESEKLQFENIALKRENLQLQLRQMQESDKSLIGAWNEAVEKTAKKHGRKIDDVERIDFLTGQIIFKEKKK